MALPPVSATPPAGSVIEALPISAASVSPSFPFQFPLALPQDLRSSAAPLAGPHSEPFPQLDATVLAERFAPGIWSAASPSLSDSVPQGFAMESPRDLGPADKESAQEVREESVPGGHVLSALGVRAAGGPSQLLAINQQFLAQVQALVANLMLLTLLWARGRSLKYDCSSAVFLAMFLGYVFYLYLC